MRYPKKYTQKEWNRFDWVSQEKLCERYVVILTDYKTKKEKLFEIIDKVNIKNLNSGISKFNKGVNQFSKMVEAPKGKKKKPMSFGISQKDYDKLFKSPKRKGNSMNFWNEDKKTRRKRNMREPVQKELDYSALTGKRSVKFF